MFKKIKTREYDIYKIFGMNFKIKNNKKSGKNRINKRKVRFYNINDKEIKLCPGHNLDVFQNKLPYYDKFLPHLSKRINSGYIIDIGANVGDTLYGMIQDNNVKFVCVEPEPEFFNYLKYNIEKLKSFYPNIDDRVYQVQKAISIETTSIALNIAHGTAAQDSASQGVKIEAVTIDNLCEQLNLLPEDCEILKIDTDGYDYDCILSGKNFFERSNALVFWENYFIPEKSEKYLNALDLLLENKYEKFYIFDNFGDYIATISGSDIKMFQKSQEKLQSNNIQYYDILACKADKVDFCNNVVQKYVEDMITLEV